MKALRHKSLMGLVYAVLLAIPLFSIISRVIYVQSNKNAYESYSGSVQTYQKNEIDNVLSFVDINKDDEAIYGFVDGYLEFYARIYRINQFVSDSIGYDELVFDSYISTFNCYAYFYVDDITTNCIFYFGDYSSDVNNYISVYIDGISNYNFDLIPLEDYQFLSDLFDNNFIYDSKNKYYEYQHVQLSTLDNVFEYSVDSIIKDNNFGNIDFLSWFSNMFLDNTNSVNNRYVHFANWYLNYVMFISCVYLLFLVLMWFINFARRLLDRGMNYDW